ncbi:MAG: transposase [Saprospiraceae bacterium]|nr:transposase [Saprospiraceae bacterium]
MKKSKFSESQIIYAIRQVEQYERVEVVCRKLGISTATFYNWKKKYGGMGGSELRRNSRSWCKKIANASRWLLI